MPPVSSVNTPSPCDRVALVLEGASKSFVVSDSGSNDARRKKGTKTSRVVESLKPTTLVVKTGESVGVVGHNGSGKSTLLKVIAGTEPPTTGRVLVSAQPTLLGVAPALQPYLSGRQNIVLGLLALGVPLGEARSLEPEIADWADIGDAIDRPLKTYSAGQSARLAFAISTAVDPEILLIDEALSTGDAAFANKARLRMEGLLAEAKNVFLVSHVADQILDTCSRAIWMHRGEMIMDGASKDTVAAYKDWSKNASNARGQEILEEAKATFSPMRIEWED